MQYLDESETMKLNLSTLFTAYLSTVLINMSISMQSTTTEMDVSINQMFGVVLPSIASNFLQMY